ncbi:MAG: hypothetical protein ACREBE_08115 [bacterium]
MIPQAQETRTAVQALEQQSTALKDQLAAMAASRRDLAARVHSANPSEAMHLQEMLQAHDANVSDMQSHLADVNNKLADLQTQSQMLVPPSQILVPPSPPPFQESRPWVDPDAMTAVFVMFSIGIIGPLSVGLMRRMWRRQPAAAPATTENVSSARLDRLEQAVDAIAIEIERVSESQRFVTKVLTERPATLRPVAPDMNDSALGEAKPFLALGAGPMEPIPVAQRQAVKQSITPH